MRCDYCESRITPDGRCPNLNCNQHTPARIGTYETVVVESHTVTGKVYHVRDNGWACVQTDTGRCASGPSPDDVRFDRIAAETAEMSRQLRNQMGL